MLSSSAFTQYFKVYAFVSSSNSILYTSVTPSVPFPLSNVCPVNLLTSITPWAFITFFSVRRKSQKLVAVVAK